MTRIVLATTNPGKLREITALLDGLGIEVISLAEYPQIGEIAEPFDTFAENAAEKARVVARATGEWAVADDSGLMVDALDGAPGVLSARVAPTDPERIAWLLGRLEGVPCERRTARFVCALALCSPEGETELWEETAEGVVALAPGGDGGFGYDPVFYYPPAGRTFGEMTQDEKGTVSHRGKALRRLREALDRV